MTAAVRATGQAAVPEPVRPDVLSYPSPTTVRFVILVVATLSAGLFAGTWIYNAVDGARWQRAVQACRNVSDFDRCAAPAQRRVGEYSLAGLGAAAVGSLTILYLAPILIERRRRLRPAGPKFAAARDRLVDLSAIAGLPRTPLLMVGSAAQRDGFSYGVPGRYRIVLPVAIAIRPASREFGALAAHELAHVRHRDVTVAWLARSAGYAVVPLLAAPVMIALTTGGFGALGDYVWRAVLLGAVVALSRAAILRSREYDADLRAARNGTDSTALSLLLHAIRDPARPGGSRLLATHPPARSRLTVLDRPAEAAKVGFVDGLTAAFLVGLIPPLVDNAVVPLLAGTAAVTLTNVVAALVTGPLAGAMLGLALWRASLLGRLTGTPSRVTPVVAGVFLGALTGGATSLARYGSNPAVDLLFGLIIATTVAGATVITASLGELWAGAAARIRGARISWGAAVVLPGLLFAVVVWFALTLAKTAQDASWTWIRAELPDYFSRPPVTIVILVLAAAAFWALWPSRPGRLTPAWLIEAGPRYEWPDGGAPSLPGTLATAAASALAGVAVLVTYRAVAGAPVDEMQRFSAYVFLAAAVGAAAALVLAVGYPSCGAAAALLAVPVATAMTMAGFLVSNTVRGGRLTGPLVRLALTKPLGPALLAETLLAAAAVGIAKRPRWQRIAPVVAMAAAAGAGSTVIGAQDVLVPTRTAPTTAAISDAADYRSRIAPIVQQKYRTIITRNNALMADRALGDEALAEALDAEVIAPLRALAATAEQMTPADSAARAVHAYCTTGLLETITSVRQAADAYRRSDPQELNDALSLGGQATGDMRTWWSLAQKL